MQIENLQEQDLKAVAYVHMQSWKKSYRGILPDDFLDQIQLESRLALRRRLFEKPSRINLVAKCDSNVVGFCDGGPNRDSNIDADAELYAIYLLEIYQGKGFASALFNTLTERLKKLKYTKMCLWVLKDNDKARRFYEYKGGVGVNEKTIKIAEKEYLEVCYLYEL